MKLLNRYEKELKTSLDEKSYLEFTEKFGWILLNISNDYDKLEKIILEQEKEIQRLDKAIKNRIERTSTEK